MNKNSLSKFHNLDVLVKFEKDKNNKNVKSILNHQR